MSVSILTKVRRRLAVAQVRLEDRTRKLRHPRRIISSGRHIPLVSFVRDEKSPWRSLNPWQINMPGMITDEEAQYYEWIGSLYEARGAAIELGPWLGKSTKHIVRGLRKNSMFDRKKLYVFDDFIWRSSWMDQYVSKHPGLSNHSDFRPLFESFTRDIEPDLVVSVGRISDYDGNEHLAKIAWNGPSIEIMYIDCGRTFDVNEGWFNIFSGSFIPDVTLLVMQDWGTHRERPRQSYNETLLFTNAHPELHLVHELSQGNIATFLYR